MMVLLSTYLWIANYVDVSKYLHPIRQTRIPFIAIIVSSITVLFVLTVFFKQTKTLKIIGIIIAIPLLPFLFVTILSQTKPLATLTLPSIVLPALVLISTYAYSSLEYFNLGLDFNNQVIPYLNLTTIIILFAYFDRFFIRLYARTIPESQMPSIIKDWTYELLDKKIFIKMSYVLLTLILIISTIERLGHVLILDVVPHYKNIAFESLVTFVAVDRVISKFKTK